eukprot:2961290-Ditylum_brightwellii.AAC.1
MDPLQFFTLYHNLDHFQRNASKSYSSQQKKALLMFPEAFIVYDMFTRPSHGENESTDITSDLDDIVANDERQITQDEDTDHDNEAISLLSGELGSANTDTAHTNTPT